MRPPTMRVMGLGGDQAMLQAHIATGGGEGNKKVISIRRNPLKSPNSEKTYHLQNTLYGSPRTNFPPKTPFP